ncbi:MAG: FG-GAP-like repeat-containing protein [Saprospiraceae bacterium]
MDRISTKITLRCYTLLICLLFLGGFSTNLLAQFTMIPGAKGADDASGGAINGQAWGDLDGDGDEDLIIYVADAGNTATSKLLINSGAPNYTFSDSTTARIDGFNDAHSFGRQMLIVDFNNDGYNDILRGFGGSNNIEIYYNDGPPSYTFGLPSTQQPDVIIGAPGDGMEWNTEGIVAVDWNQDGWLDIIIDNDGGGNDIWENDQSGGFTYISPGTGAGQTGFPADHVGDGDYMTAADIDDNGYVDLYGRKTNVSNYWWFNPTTSQFQTQANPNIVSSESDKGGTMFCDFDSDGDLDLFWTSNGNNQIWRNDGSNTWTATGIPGSPLNTLINIDGCDCGDYDNDGDIDIVMGGSGSNSYLLENTTSGGSLSFVPSNLAISANSESITFTDYDNDGDLDLYVLVSGAANQLWENNTNNQNFLSVNALYDNGNGSTRDAIGANVVLKNCEDKILSIQPINGGKGHGSQHKKKAHFGVDPTSAYIVEVHYVYVNGVREIISKSVIPNSVPNQEITILNTDDDDVFVCSDTDQDRIDNFTDLDDDNDGIPDSEELLACGMSDWTTGIYTVGNTNYAPSINNSATVSTANVSFTAVEKGTGNTEFLRINNNLGGNSTEGVFFRGSNSTNADNCLDWMMDFSTTVYNVELYFGSLDNADEIVTTAYYQGNPIHLDENNFEVFNPANLSFTSPNIVSCANDPTVDYNTYDEAFKFQLAGPVDSIIFKAYKNTGNAGNVTLFISDFAYCLPQDSDRDGIPDHLDLDADNDGIPDLVEAGGTDTDGDGTVDALLDADSDGIPDSVDPDFIACAQDTAPNDGICDAAQGGPDADGDGIQDADDPDRNGDGVADVYDPATGGMSIPNLDTDGDGIKDILDLDADNDGIADVVEAGGTDTNGDGLADNFIDIDSDGFNDQVDGDVGNDGVENTAQALQLTGVDSDNDGLPNSYPTGDTDQDGRLDQLDLDADNDGIQDLVEAGGADENADGVVDNYNPITGLFLSSGDDDQDGFSNWYDSDSNNDDTAGDVGTNPLVLTTVDNNLDGAPDDGFDRGDMDNDGVPNHLDLDADNDGILDVVEANVTDSNRDGIADDALTNDSDNNGWSNSYDGANGGTVPVATDDTNNDGYPDSYDTQNQDSDARPNFLDIDADNDGIVDNTEAQATFNYVAPDKLDSDGDGIDDAYDALSGFGGEGIIPENTDLFDEPDYLDLDTDNDGDSDSMEGHDTNGDGFITPSDNPKSGTGLAGGTADIDGDGLLDGYDNDTSLATGRNATNDDLEPLSHPDADDAGAERDWRQGPCAVCKMVYAMQDGTGNQTTSYVYDAGTEKLITTTDNFGTIRIQKNNYCEIGGWRYYYNPANPSQALFALSGDAADLDKLDYIELNSAEDFDDREAGDTGSAYSRIMSRDWFIKIDGALTGELDARFFFPGSDFGTNGYQAADMEADTYDLSDTPDVKWFETAGWIGYDPTTINANAMDLTNLSGFTELFPAVEANTTTGLSETDGSAATIGNGRNYVELSGLKGSTGGTAAWGAGESALPIELSSFMGGTEGCNTRLVWTSELEKNFNYYNLERSIDGINFETLKKIKGVGGDRRQSYQYTDYEASTDNYYRLKMVDLDGSYEYSEIIFVATDCEEIYDIAVYPNPVSISDPVINVKFFSSVEETGFMITDINGEVLRQINFGVEKEWNTVRIEVGDLPVGVYFLKVIGKNRIAKSFVIQE